MVVRIRAKMAHRKKLAWPLRSSQLLLAVERLLANDGWVTSRVKAVSRRRRGPQARLYRACHPAILDHRGRRLTPATLLPPPSMRGFTPPVTLSEPRQRRRFKNVCSPATAMTYPSLHMNARRSSVLYGFHNSSAMPHNRVLIDKGIIRPPAGGKQSKSEHGTNRPCRLPLVWVRKLGSSCQWCARGIDVPQWKVDRPSAIRQSTAAVDPKQTKLLSRICRKSSAGARDFR